MDTSNDAQPFLTAVNARIDALLAPREAPLALDDILAVMRDVCLAPRAKRVRPRLVRFFGQAVGVDPMTLIPVAVAAELCHTASLLHDDVVDDGHERRGVPTMNTRVGNPAAVLGGDLL